MSTPHLRENGASKPTIKVSEIGVPNNDQWHIINTLVTTIDEALPKHRKYQVQAAVLSKNEQPVEVKTTYVAIGLTCEGPERKISFGVRL